MSTIIRADTDQLRAVARQMRTTADEIMSGASAMHQAMGALDATWSGSARDRGMARWGEITPKYPPAVERLIHFANELEALAQRLDDAAAVFGAGGTGVVVTPTMNPLSLDQIRDALLKQFGELGNLVLRLITAFGSLLQDPSHLWDLLKDLGALASLFSPSEISQLWNNRDHLFDILGNMTKYFDPVIDQYFSSLLPQSMPNSIETLRFHLGGDVTIPGAEVGIPGSPEVLAAREAAITRNKDGSYTLTLTDEGGVGLKEKTPDAKGHIGDINGGFAPSAEAEIAIKAKSEVQYRFDPKVPGDMTKMATFMGALGVTSALLPNIPITVSPTLAALKDNLQSVKFGVTGEGKASADFSPLIKLAGVEGSISAEGGGSLTKSPETGHWESSSYVEVAGGANVQVLTLQGGLEGKVTLQSITDMETGQQSAKVSVEIKAEAGNSLSLKDIKDFIPKNSLGVNIKSDSYGKITVEYTIDKPVESVQQTLTSSMEKGHLDLKPIIDNSTVQVKGTVGTEQSFSVGGEVTPVASQTIGINAEGTMTRESEVTMYRTPGH